MTSNPGSGDPSVSLAFTQTNGKEGGRKLRGRAIAKSVLGRAVHPGHLYKAARLQMSRKAHRHTYDDAQLALYSKILPSEFLHYGYFDDPGRRPEEISLAEVTRAQVRYSELLLDLAGDPRHPVLDVGCGMGGLCRLLKCRSFSPTALTPDRLQVSHIRATQPDVPVVRCKLEDLKTAEYAQKFGTVITAESLQYLKLPRALPVMEQVLRPGGRWIACDYFHTQPSADRSCHEWDEFARKLSETGWRLTFQRDITAHIMPTLAYIHMWAVRFGIPLMQFSFLRLRRKQPALHHILSGALDRLEGLAAANLELIDPVAFARSKKYMLLSMERA